MNRKQDNPREPVPSVPGQWSTGAPMLDVPPDRAGDWLSIKDPSIVHHGGAWHLFVTVRARTRSHAIAYYRFDDFDQASTAAPILLPAHPGYWCAPQVFYFRPHRQWYLVCQAKSPAFSPPYQAAFSTSPDIANPSGWSTLRSVDLTWRGKDPYLDFWVICDASNAFLFFTCDNGEMWRSETPLNAFPYGWSQPELAYRGAIFEASHIYAAPDGYFCLVEAQRQDDRRYFKILHADHLRGNWHPAPGAGETYASPENVTQRSGHWTDSISHGELLREGIDERLTARPDAPFLFQGVLHRERTGKPYGEIPWKLGLLEPAPSA
ncbi:MAG: non-reducing end alpha-L-arabinofuranosidase family hydrolase [Opitutales bacterium]